MQEYFDISEQIHSGRQCNIYRATRRSDGTAVILKTCKIEHQQRHFEQLQSEYQLSQKLRSRRSVRPIDIKTFSNELVVVFRDDELSPIDQFIGPSGININRFLRIAQEIAKATFELHAQGIAHRNISPDNIVVDETFETAKLIDFGLASAFTEHNTDFELSTSLIDSLPYISPEQTGRTNTEVDWRSDIYSLGCCFYRMLTGSDPFKANNAADIIYAHIAQNPTPVHIVREGLPPALSAVINKLLEKDPASRYQSLKPVITDLKRIEQSQIIGTEIDDFQPSKENSDSVVRLKAKLYGRDAELATLKKLLKTAATQSQLIEVTGPAGIGKTALIRELFSEIGANRNFFIRGKFNQLNRGKAYSAIADALAELTQQCLNLSNFELDDFRAAIQEAVGSLGQVLLEIVPQLEDIIGPQAKINSASPRENTQRRNLVMQNVFRCICSQGHTIVMFLDDLQWADSASIALIDAMLDAPKHGFMCFLSYRDCEISKVHPAAKLLHSLPEREIQNHKIALENLNPAAIDAWLAELLENNRSQLETFSTQIALRSAGNPFHIQSLLNKLIQDESLYRSELGFVEVDTEKLKQLPVGDIIDHLQGLIEKLPTDTRTFLEQLAVLGNRFSIKQINIVLGCTLTDYEARLSLLINAKLLIKVENNLQFVHDRVQQATLEGMNQENISRLHLHTGRKILSDLQERGEEKAKVDLYIQHFNAAETYVKEPDERLLLARLNVQQGRYYKFNAAYQGALNCFRTALKFIPGSPFDTDHDLAIELYSSLGEVLFLNQQYKEGEQAFAEVSSNATSPLDKANASIVQFRHFASNQDLPLAVRKVEQSLLELNIELPRDDLAQKNIDEFSKTVASILKLGIHEMVTLPLCENPLAIAQQEVLAVGSLPAFLGAPEKFPFLPYKSIEITLQQGISDHSPLGMMAMAAILFAAEEVELGIQLGEAALNQSTLIDDKHIRTQLYTMYACNIFHFHAPGHEVYEYFDMASEFAMEASDYDYGAMAASQRPYYAWNFDPNLKVILDSLEQTHRKLEEFGKDDPIFMNKFLWQFLSVLCNPNSDGISFKGDYIDEAWLHDYLLERKHYTYLGIYTTLKMQALFIMQHIDEVISYAPTVKSYTDTMPGTMVVFLYEFCSSLAILQKGFKQTLSQENMGQVKASIERLRSFSPHCPDNFLGKQKLLEAAYAATNCELGESIQLFEQATETIQQSLIPIEQAISYEFFGRYLLSKNINGYAISQLKLAYESYKNWGHLSKCSALKREFPDLIPEQLDQNRDLNSQLNLEALSSSIELLSEVKEIDTLLGKLLETIQQNSGATSASIILHTNATTELRAFKDKLKGDLKHNNDINKDKETNSTITDGQYRNLSQYKFKQDLIEQCLLHNEDFALESYNYTQSAFSNKQTSKVLSVLVITLRQQNKVTGVIYLENDLHRNGFSKQHIQFLSLLAGQAAIALENAQAFTSINQEKDYSKSIIDNSASMICGLNNEGRVIFSNPISEIITGYSQGDLQSKNLWQLLFPGDAYQQVDRLFQAMQDGIADNIELQITRSDGSQRDILWNSFSNPGSNTEGETIIGFATDITIQNKAKRKIIDFNRELSLKVDERTQELNISNQELSHAIEHLKDTQEQLIESEKMASLGSLVAGIAHEINTPIGISVTAATHFRDKTAIILSDYNNARMSQQQLEFYLEEGSNVAYLIYNNMRRATDLIASFKLISVDQTNDRIRRFNIKEYIQEIRLSLDTQINYRKISLAIDCPIDLEIESYPGDFSQIFTNLLSNSLKHAFKEEEEGTVSITGHLESEHLIFSYKDNGCGIPDKNIKRIFDPFFTTGQGRGGSGLGLHILYNIIKQKLGGSIECHSKEGQWTQFIIRLPLKLPSHQVTENQ